jgi:hypothetical protein
VAIAVSFNACGPAGQSGNVRSTAPFELGFVHRQFAVR